MQNFVYQNPTKVIFGQDTIQQIGKEIKKHGIEKAIIKFCGLELAESQILKLILQYYNEFKKEKK